MELDLQHSIECQKCKHKAYWHGWIADTPNWLGVLGDIIFLMFTPKKWIKEYTFFCVHCGEVTKLKKEKHGE